MNGIKKLLIQAKSRRGSTLILVLCAMAIMTALGVSLLVAANAVSASAQNKIDQAQATEYARTALLAVDKTVRDGGFNAVVLKYLVAPVAGGAMPEDTVLKCSDEISVPSPAEKLKVELELSLLKARVTDGVFGGGTMQVKLISSCLERKVTLFAQYRVTPNPEDPAVLLWKLETMKNRE